MPRRRGRGIDFEHRFKTSRWAEDLLITALQGAGFVVVRIGLSEVSADNTIPDLPEGIKIPDLLVFDQAKLSEADLATLRETDFTKLAADDFDPAKPHGALLRKAAWAIEVEFSPYRASEMKGRNWQPPDPAKLARRPRKHATAPTAPNIYIKHEDLGPLMVWQEHFGVRIIVAHVFDQEAFAAVLSAVKQLQTNLTGNPATDIPLQITSGIFSKIETYNRTDAQGAAERKPVFLVTPHAATRVGAVRDVQVSAQLALSASKKYVTHPIFDGGAIEFDPAFLSLLRRA